MLLSHFDNLLVEAFNDDTDKLKHRLLMEYPWNQDDEKKDNNGRSNEMPAPFGGSNQLLNNDPKRDQESPSWPTRKKVAIIGGALLLTGSFVSVALLRSRKSERKRKSTRRMNVR